MLYYIHIWLKEIDGTNVFRYITFRAIGSAMTSFLLCLLCGNWVIRKLIGLKIGQPIRTKEEVHKLAELHGGKRGTPTMGGVLILGAVTLSTLLWARPDNAFIWLALGSMLWLGAVGFVDDYLKVTKKKSDGLPGRLKLLAQFALAAVVTAFFVLSPALQIQAKELFVPFYKEALIHNLGWATFLFFALVIVGTSNAVNLTDGLDGLATGCTITAAFAYGLIAYAAGNVKIAAYLQIPFYPQAGELTVLCMALLGAGMGFLWFNAYPARVFMGDTGSLAIGGVLGVVAICTKQELLLLVVGGIFVIEAMSVILQVASFKLTGKRIFRMSPIHHHFELLGWKENTVIVRFWILAIMFAFLGLATLKLR
ncbi:MAG: phospho-N-acetylmuramoyl-pentapeptide-transferase [Verrucomicrobiota bacterium]